MLWALIGEETLLVDRALKKLLGELVPSETRDFNFDRFEGAEVQARRLLEITETLPVFASHRVILVVNAQEIRKSEGELLEPCLSRLPETTHLILIAETIDRRLGFWKTVLESAKVRQFKSLTPREVPQWITEESRGAGYGIAHEAARWVGDAVGTDLVLLQSTLQKVFLSVGKKREISLPDVEACVGGISWKSVFDLTDAVGRRDLSKALVLFQSMFSVGESPIALLAILARHFRILIRVREGQTDGVPPYFLGDYQRQAGQFSSKRLQEKMEKIFLTDWSLKSSALRDSLLFERLLIDLCR